jgi:phosphatidylinositol alpha-1,6-mannosyltransferase
MERLIWHVVDALRLDYIVHVVGPSGAGRFLSDDVHAAEVQATTIFSFLLKAGLKALWSVFLHRPTIVFAGSGLVAPIVWLAARLVGSPCVVYLHGLDIKVSHAVYQTCWLPFFRRFDCVIVNSHYTRQLALDAGVLLERITIVHPGVTLPKIEDAAKQALAFRSRYDFDRHPMMLFVGRITERKGLACFAEHILPRIVLELPDAILVVIGGAPVDALQGGKNERSRVETILKKNDLEKNVYFLGHCSDKELGGAYFAADVLVFPVQESESDIEGFGMVALEAAAHGLPTVAFSVGGVPDAVSDGCCGKLISPGANKDFAQAVVEQLCERSKPGCGDECRKFAQKFEWVGFGGKIRSLLRTLTQRNESGVNH